MTTEYHLNRWKINELKYKLIVDPVTHYTREYDILFTNAVSSSEQISEVLYEASYVVKPGSKLIDLLKVDSNIFVKDLSQCLQDHPEIKAYTVDAKTTVNDINSGVAIVLHPPMPTIEEED